MKKLLPFAVRGRKSRAEAPAGGGPDSGYRKRGAQAGSAVAPASGPRVGTRAPCGA